MRDYRRKRKRQSRAGQDSAPEGFKRDHDHSFSQVTQHAAYIPARDGKPQWESPQAEFMGDPPIGRRAIDKRH